MSDQPKTISRVAFGMKRTIAASRRQFPDLSIAVDDQLAEGDRVATRWTATMTHAGKRITTTGITIDRFEGGMIVEAWRSRDMLGLLRQLSRV
jgi:predicted ester cyclase